MLTAYVHVRVGVADVDRALVLGGDEGFSCRLALEWKVEDPSVVTLEYNISFFDADSSGPEQRQSIDRVHDLLSAAGIWFEAAGSGVSIGDGLSRSRFVVKPLGSIDPSESLTIFAVDRADFERQWNLFASTGVGLDQNDYEVEVTGLAAND